MSYNPFHEQPERIRMTNDDDTTWEHEKAELPQWVTDVELPDRRLGPPEPTLRGAVLEEARTLIEGDRNQTYGSPTQNFQNTADIWNALLRHKLKDGEVITATEVATLMVGLKLARTVAQPKRDNFVDMAGYAGCAWEVQERELGDVETDR